MAVEPEFVDCVGEATGAPDELRLRGAGSFVVVVVVRERSPVCW